MVEKWLAMLHQQGPMTPGDGDKSSGHGFREPALKLNPLTNLLCDLNKFPNLSGPHLPDQAAGHIVSETVNECQVPQ